MIEELKRWSDAYCKGIVPRGVFDGQELSIWTKEIKRLYARGKIPEEHVKELEKAGMVWKMSVVEAKWFANFHLAREYVNAFPDQDINSVFDGSFCSEERPDWVEASRWLERQRELYRKQKLTNLKVHLLKHVLGAMVMRK